MTRTAHGDSGSVALELVVLAPAFALLFLLVVVAGRAQTSRLDVEAAARAGARSITQARDPAAAVARAREDAAASLPLRTSACRSMGWDARLDDERATVTVSCTLDLSDAMMLPVPGHYTVTGTADEVFDAHRERADP